MSDWEVVTGNKSNKPESESEWEIVHPVQNSRQPQNESLGISALKAPYRVVEDLYNSGANLVKNIPEYYESAKNNIPDAFTTMKEHPFHAAQQATAGLGELGQNIFNFPHDVANYASNRLNLLPKDINEKIQMARMPDSEKELNNVFGKPKYPGEELIRSGGRNALNLLGAANLFSTFNPAKLTANNIAKDVVETGKKMQEKYSGESGLYNKLSQKAEKKGITQANIDPNKIDIETIKKYSAEKNTDSLDKFLKEKNITNAQKAISDLGFTQRKLENKTTLIQPEKDQLKAVKNAKKYIQENMFKDDSGKLHEDLLNQHKKIQRGYAEEVIPYTKNISINKFKNRKLLPTQLVNSLSQGEFAVKRGKYHPAIQIRNVFRNHPYLTGAGGFGLGKALYDEMIGNNSEGNK